MAISHLSSGETMSVLPLRESLEQTQTTALFREAQLEVMRLVLPAGKGMPEHAVNGPITVQCIEGEVNFSFENTQRLMRAGDLLYLAAGVPHKLTAIRNASVLVTIVLQEPSASPV
ncbi:quercetin dioxygenase-like cupin family protein [Paraburkholderia sp. GAS448]|uniref:cupin domain-containing protein n=1 Tax=Paraburkholderia sp. GAS448 TaxID=3035136 RepID=UPI003D1CB19B